MSTAQSIGGEHEVGSPAEVGTFELVELILKNRAQLHRIIRVPAAQVELIPRFLAVAFSGFLMYGVAITVVLSASGVWPELTAFDIWLRNTNAPLWRFVPIESQVPLAAPWLDGSAFKLMAAYCLGLIAAAGVCLPSLYFYGLLSQIRMTMLEVTVHTLKSMAVTAVALVGIVPIYAAVCLGFVLIDTPQSVLDLVLFAGLVLPFIAGMWGTRSLYVGLSGLSDTVCENVRQQRACFLNRLVVSWAVCYTAVSPVMIFTLWQRFGT